MSNKTELQANNVDLASILSTIQELPLYEPPEGQYAWKKYIDSTKEVFVDYIVDDDEYAYPNSGLQGGYWYELASDIPVDFTYSGTYSIEYGTENVEDIPHITWKLKLLTSGIFNLKATKTPIIDVFGVGGGGGGAGCYGSGGGGAGGTYNAIGNDAVINTGGGGGGGGCSASNKVLRKAGDGGSGIVILRGRYA